MLIAQSSSLNCAHIIQARDLLPLYVLLDKRHMTKSLMTPSNRTALCTAKISALSLAMLLMQSNMAFAAPTTLVQTINNIANASYDVNSIKQNSISNQVQVKASALPEYGINLTQQPLRSTVAPNTLVNWVNVLSNTSYSLRFATCIW